MTLDRAKPPSRVLGTASLRQDQRMTDDLTARVAVLESKVDGLMATVLTRLLDAAVPAPGTVSQGADDAQLGDHDAHEPDDSQWDGARDWTDPFIGLDAARDYRDVGRLEAGEQLPFVPVPNANGGAMTVGDAAIDRWRATGEGSFDEWNRETHQPEVAARADVGWVAPIDLGGEMVE